MGINIGNGDETGINARLESSHTACSRRGRSKAQGNGQEARLADQVAEDRLRLGLQGQEHTKHASLSRRALDLNVSTMGPGDRVSDAQAQPRSLSTLLHRRGSPVKALEDPFPLLRFEANAGVLNVQHRPRAVRS